MQYDIGWLPVFDETNATLLHIDVNGRYGQADGGTHFQSRIQIML